MNYNALHQTTRRILLIACAAVLAAGLMISLPQRVHAQTITPPPVPEDIKVPEGNEAFLVGHATGTQNYVCLPCDATTANCPLGVAFKLFTPQATLFDDQGDQLTTHFFSPNVVKDNAILATWEDSRDTSTVWASLVKGVTVRQGSIDWLLLNVKDTGGAQAGPTGGDRLTKTTFIQRLRTFGGVAPAFGCTIAADVGHQAFVPYRADYFFYRKTKDDN
jgi:hypothetical protein